MAKPRRFGSFKIQKEQLKPKSRKKPKAFVDFLLQEEVEISGEMIEANRDVDGVINCEALFASIVFRAVNKFKEDQHTNISDLQKALQNAGYDPKGKTFDT